MSAPEKPDAVDPDLLQRLQDFARQLAEVQSRIDARLIALQEIKGRLRDVEREKRDAEEQLESLQQEFRHVTGCIVGNQRGQKTFDFEYASATDPEAKVKAGDGTIAKHVLTALQQYGLSGAKYDALKDSCYGDELETVEDLERLINKTNGYYWKKVKGRGQKFATGEGDNDFPQIHARFRQAHPLEPADDRERRCSDPDCAATFRGTKQCPQCGSAFWTVVEPGDSKE